MELLILDKNLNLKNVLTNWEYFSFSQKLNARGEFELSINANLPQADELYVGQLLYLSPTACGYITRKEVVSEGGMSDEVINISGIELKDLISSRITAPPEGQEAYVYEKVKSEEIVYDLIEKLIINPKDARKRIPIFRLNDAQGIGTKQDFSTRFKPLDTQIYELLLSDQLGLRCSVNLNQKIAALSVYQGIDRTIEQTKNASAIFSLNMGTLEKAIKTQDISSYKSVGIIGGQGGGTERTIIEIPENNDLSGFDRWEIFIDLRDAKTEDEMTSRGNSVLAEYDKVYAIDGSARDINKFTFALGDTVTIQDNNNNYQNVQVTGITRDFDQDHQEKQSLIFGKAPVTIAQAINRRLSGLNNILTN